MKDEHQITVSDELIAKYLTGEATPEEAMLLHEWKQETESNQSYFMSFQSAWTGTLPGNPSAVPDKHKAWTKVSQSIAPAKPIGKQAFFKKDNFLLKIAASIVLAITAAGTIYLFKSSAADLSQQASGKPQLIELPDESHVTLNLNSTLTYKEGFKENPREVTLKGEAFFKIKPDRNQPFVVHTESGNIKVLGTSFNVSTNNGQLEVSVAEGKVLVYTARDNSYLGAGQTAVLPAGSNSIIVQDAINLNNIGYATHTFVFKDTPMKEVIRCFNKAYPGALEVNRSMENCKFTGTFGNESTEDIVSLLADALDLTVTKNGQTFVLQGKGCP